MQAANAELFKASTLDIIVTRMDLNGMYSVSGKDAPAFHAKLKQLPREVSDLVVGDLANGSFTLQKPSAGSAPKTTAKAK